MKYLGGKYKIRNWLAENIAAHNKESRPIWEPFCGGLNALVALKTRLCTDVCAPLISLYQHIRDGWIPPDSVTEEEYRAAKLLPFENPMHGFCAFGLSFGGKYFGGYARRSKGINDHSYFAKANKSSLMRDVDALRDNGTEFRVVNFLQEAPTETPYLIYCDPPYAATTEYSAARGFDHATFYARCREWAKHTTVIVSERVIPDGVGYCIAETQKKAEIACSVSGKTHHIERLFLINP